MNMLDIRREARKVLDEARIVAKENKPVNPVHVVKLASLLSELASETSSATDPRNFSGM